MELQFQNNILPCLRKVLSQTTEQEQTLEIRLTDEMADIGRVLGAWGQVLVRGKEWNSDNVGVSGGVMVWVLYAAEDDGRPQWVEGWMPFQMKWDIPNTERDGTICVIPLLQYVDARSISARKLMVRAVVSTMAEAAVVQQAEMYAPVDVPKDVQLLKKNYPMMIPTEAGEKIFSLEEDISIPGSKGKPVKILRYCLQPEVLEEKVMAGRVVFRGMAILHILFLNEEGKICNADIDIPYAQYCDLDREYDQQATASVMPLVTALELDLTEEGLCIKAGMAGQYTIFDKTMIEIVEDAYSPQREVTACLDMMQLPAVLEYHDRTLRASVTTDAEGEVMDMEFYPGHLQAYRTSDGVSGELSGRLQMLCYDENGDLQASQGKWSEQIHIPADENSHVSVKVFPTGRPAAVREQGISMESDIHMNCVTEVKHGVPVVSGLNFGDLKEPDPHRPSLILRKCGNESLWQLAKQNGSTVAQIQVANGLEGEPEPDQMLLIPVS